MVGYDKEFNCLSYRLQLARLSVKGKRQQSNIKWQKLYLIVIKWLRLYSLSNNKN